MHDSLRTFLPQITLLVMACLWITGCSKKTEPGPAPKAPLVVGQPAGDVPLNQPAQQPEDDLDRKAAAWVVKLGGSVRISANGIITEYPKDGELPERGFQLIAVNFIKSGEQKKLSNDGVEELAGLKHLTSLTIQGDGTGSGVTDFSFLKGLENLEYLSLQEAGIPDAGLVHVKGLKKLKTLNIEHFFGTREITDAGLVNLQNLKDLEVLWLWGANITDVGLENIRGLTKLKMLKLGRSPITDAGLTHLKDLGDLRELHLVGTQVTDVGLDTVKGFSKLELLNLDGTKVTDAGVEAFQASLPKCKVHRPK